MSVDAAEWLVKVLGLYLAAGVLVAIVFIVKGPARIDPAARGMPWAARLFLLPGVAALWPLMLQKWLTQKEPPHS